jgi:hypothetical protein
MALRELCLFTLVVTLAGSTTAETLDVRIQEYEVPTPNSRPHDPALAPDGSLWYTRRLFRVPTPLVETNWERDCEMSS